MQQLASFLYRILGNDQRFSDEILLEKLQKSWPDVAGEISKQAEPVEYSRGVLTLATTSSVWAQQVLFFRGTIMEKYSKVLPQIKLSDIRTRAGKTISGIQLEKKQELSSNDEAEAKALAMEVHDQKQRNIFEKILVNDFLWKKNDQRRECPLCGRKHFGGEVCLFCKQEDLQANDLVIAQFLDNTPWARFVDVKEANPQISEDHYFKVKEKIRNKTRDRLQKLYYEIIDGGHKAKLEKACQQAIFKYVMLKTGLTPDKINDKILSEQVGEKLLKVAYQTSKK